MIRNMRRISLFVLIAFTLSTLFFQVVNVTYAENDDNSDLEERVEALEEEVKTLKKEVEELKGDTDRGIGDSLLDIGKFAVGVCAGAVGAVGVIASTASGAASLGLSAPVSIPVGVVSAGAVVAGGATAWSASNNLVNDVVNLFSDDD